MAGDDSERSYNQNGLGRMVAALSAQLNEFQTNWREQDRRATDGRKFMYDKIEAYATNVQHLANQLNEVTRDVAEMKPAVRDWVASKNRAEGAAWSARVLWGVGGAFCIGIFWVFDHFLSIVPHIAGK